MIDDDLPKFLQNQGGRLNNSGRYKKILAFSILTLGLGLFFYLFPESKVLAEGSLPKIKISAGIIDPLSRIGKGIAIEDGEEKEMPILDNEKKKPNLLEKKILSLVEGYPIEEMAKYISQQDDKAAAFLVAIAKKESAWGKRTPKKNGKECFNYWGYRGGESPTESGYSCFDSPEHAVAVVGERIQKLVDQGLDTPERMLVWKCGSSCASHDPGGVRKWVSDVSLYVNKLN